MAKKSRKRADHPRRPTIVRRDVVPPSEAEDQPLIRELRRVLYQDDPLELLQTASQLVYVTERRGPLAEEPQLSLSQLVETFEGTDVAATTAVLHVLGLLTADEVLAARIQRTLAQRRQPMPAWLRGLPDAEVARVREMRHVQRDGDDYLLDVRIPGSPELTVLVYVDNNMNGIVKDAFLIGEPLDVVEAKMTEISDPDMAWSDVDPATARALLEDAVEQGALLDPPVETETWPSCRAAVRWMLRLLPEGGAAPVEHEWSKRELTDLKRAFLDSQHGLPFDDEVHRSLLDVLLWFGTSQGIGDPTRWTPVNVEILLANWFPRMGVAEVELLMPLGDLLRAFIRWCHQTQGLRPDLTSETLASVNRWEPEYLRQIQAARSLEDVLGWGPLDDPAVAVGGREALESLDAQPLPDEEFDWSDIPEDIAPMVAEILALCDANADQLLDVEHRTANRRLLRRVALADPGIFRGRGAARTAAAAICWMVARANDSVSTYGPLTTSELLAPFGVSSASQRASRFRRALGLAPVAPTYLPIPLGSPDFLVSARRAEILDEYADAGG